MTLAAEQTRPAYPLGRPADRERFGMTPEQARVYHYLVHYGPAQDEPFLMGFRNLASVLRIGIHNAHTAVDELCKRGWMKKASGRRYQFVQPVMRFRAPAPESLKRSNAHRRTA